MSVDPVRPRLIATQDASQAQSLIASFASSPSDQCLAYHLDALLLLHRIYQIPSPLAPSQIPDFTLQVDRIIHDLEALSNRARDSSLSCSGNQALCAEYRMFRLYEKYCECVCLSKACEILLSPPFEPPVCAPDNDDHSAEEEDQDATTPGALVFLWMSRACSTVESVINEAFPPDLNDSIFLSTAPDHMFTIIAFCAITLIQSQVTALRYRPNGLHRGEEFDELVERASNSLARLVLPDSQLPRRYAKVLSTMLQRLKKRKNEKGLQMSRSLRRQETNGVHSPMVMNGRANGGDLLALATASMQEEGDALFLTNHTAECVLPSITDASNFLDPTTWLQDSALDWEHYFTAEHAHQPAYGGLN
jgi:hypothetical protein